MLSSRIRTENDNLRRLAALALADGLEINGASVLTENMRSVAVRLLDVAAACKNNVRWKNDSRLGIRRSAKQITSITNINSDERSCGEIAERLLKPVADLQSIVDGAHADYITRELEKIIAKIKAEINNMHNAEDCVAGWFSGNTT